MTAILINDMGDGGAQQSLARLLAGIPTDRIRLILIRNIILHDLPPGLEPIILDASGRRLLISLALRLKVILASEGITLVQSHLYRSNFINVISRILGSRHRVNLVNSGRAGRLLDEGLKGRLTLILQKILYPRADLVVCKSQGMAWDLKRHVKGPWKVEVIPNPFDIHALEHLSQRGKEVSRGTEALRIVSLGRLIALKNHGLAIQSVKTLKERGISTRLAIYGEGSHRPQLENQIHELLLDDVVTLPGFIDDTMGVLGGSDVLLSLSRTEGFPNVLVEAMIAGAFVISTDCISGPREILARGTDPKTILPRGMEITDCGILVSVDDPEAVIHALEWVLHNPERVDIMKQNARRRVEEWDISKISLRYEAILFPKDSK